MMIYTDSAICCNICNVVLHSQRSLLYYIQCRVTHTALSAVLFTMLNYTHSAISVLFAMSFYTHSAICYCICYVELHSQRYLLFYLECSVTLTALSAVLFAMSRYTHSAICSTICNVVLHWQRFLLYYLQCRFTLTTLSVVLIAMSCYIHSDICCTICDA
jgi:hypothetical protein